MPITEIVLRIGRHRHPVNLLGIRSEMVHVRHLRHGQHIEIGSGANDAILLKSHIYMVVHHGDGELLQLLRGVDEKKIVVDDTKYEVEAACCLKLAGS